MKKLLDSRWFQVVLGVVAAVLVGWAALKVDWGSLADTLREVDLAIWLVAVAIGVAWKLTAKIARSHVLIVAVARARGVTPPTWWSTASLFTSTHALGQILWPPVGISLRTLGLVRGGLPVVAAAEVQVGERVAEAIALLAMGGVVAIAAPGAIGGLFGSAAGWLVGALAVLTAIAIAAVVLSRRVRAAWSSGLWPLMWSGLWALVSHVGDVAILLLASRALGIELPVAPALIAFLAVNSAAIIPLIPGQLGVAEAAVVLGLGWGGIAAEPALAVALAYRAAYLMPMIVLGLPLLFADLRRRRERDRGMVEPCKLPMSRCAG